MATIFASLVIGCAGDRGRPVVMVGRGQEGAARCERIVLAQDDVKQGLMMILDELARQLGPIDTVGMCKDYSAMIQADLAEVGMCRLEKLDCNGVAVDILACFRTDRLPGTLVMEAYLNGGANPALRTVNRCYVQRY